LVHIERQYRAAAGERRRVIHGPLIDELAITRRPGDQHPARAAALGFAHCREFCAPAVDAAEISVQRVFQSALRRAFLTEPREEELVKYHRCGRIRPRAFKAVNYEPWRFCKIELGERRGDRIEQIDRTAVIILVMTDDQPL